MKRSDEKAASPKLKLRGQNERGFSLIELSIALVILTVGLLGMAELQLSSITGNAFSNNMTIATGLAQDKIEELKRLPNSDAALSAGDHDEGLLPVTAVFSRSYKVSDLSAEVKQVTVKVWWTDRTEHSVMLSTLKAK